MAKRIEQLIQAERWYAARRELRHLMRDKPEDHWLLTRLGLTYYEERKYKTALRYEERARRIAPFCPLVLWDCAGSLQMLHRHDEALEVYQALTRRGARRIAFGACGEGLAWANGLVADCYYRIALSFKDLGESDKALAAIAKHLDMRGPGCRSIYALAEINRLAENIRSRRNSHPIKGTNRRARPWRSHG